MTPSPTQSAAMNALRTFLLAALPTGVEVISGLINRVPEPRQGTFVVMTPLRFTRLSTNVDTAEDVKFTGSIAGAVLDVTDVSFGEVKVGATVFGTGVAVGTVITALGTGTGGIGTYAVTPEQTVPSSDVLASGAKEATQNAMLDVQLDFHSKDPTIAGDMAQTISTLFRDEYATQSFAEQDPAVATPLYADDPRQMPFVNDQQQYEWRWVVEACLQVNQTVTVPQQYADEIVVDLIDVDVAYPPA